MVVKRQLGNVICAILLALMETNRLVPWLRQSDNRTDCEGLAPRARRAREIILYRIFKFSKALVLESPSDHQSTPVGLS